MMPIKYIQMVMYGFTRNVGMVMAIRRPVEAKMEDGLTTGEVFIKNKVKQYLLAKVVFSSKAGFLFFRWIEFDR